MPNVSRQPACEHRHTKGYLFIGTIQRKNENAHTFSPREEMKKIVRCVHLGKGNKEAFRRCKVRIGKGIRKKERLLLSKVCTTRWVGPKECLPAISCKSAPPTQSMRNVITQLSIDVCHSPPPFPEGEKLYNFDDDKAVTLRKYGEGSKYGNRSCNRRSRSLDQYFSSSGPGNPNIMRCFGVRRVKRTSGGA